MIQWKPEIRVVHVLVYLFDITLGMEVIFISIMKSPCIAFYQEYIT